MGWCCWKRFLVQDEEEGEVPEEVAFLVDAGPVEHLHRLRQIPLRDSLSRYTLAPCPAPLSREALRKRGDGRRGGRWDVRFLEALDHLLLGPARDCRGKSGPSLTRSLLFSSTRALVFALTQPASADKLRLQIWRERRRQPACRGTGRARLTR